MSKTPNSTSSPTGPPRFASQLDGRSWFFLAALILYFVAFFGWTNDRWLQFKLRLSWLLVPDVLVSEWVGGDWAGFHLLDRVPVALVAIGILLTAFTIGTVIIDLLAVGDRLSRLELIVFGTGIGLSLLSLFTLLVGLAGLLRSRGTFAAALLVVILLAWSRRKAFEAFRSSARVASVKADESGWFVLLAKTMCLPFALFIMLGGMLPPWHFDVREYHAQVPKEWYELGQIDFMPHNVYGNMPLGAELHSIIAMNAMWGEENWWWGTLVGKTVIASFALLTTLAVYAMGRRFFSPAAGAVAAFLFISTPWIGWVSMSGLIEGASAFYTITTLQALLIWAPNRPRESTGLVAIAGFLAGSAVACKYPALLFVVAPAFLVLIGRMVQQRAVSWRPLGVFVLSVALGCGIWFGKNAVSAGNPTYPLLYEVFGGRTRDAAKDEQWTRAHRAPSGGFSLAALRRSAEVLLIDSRHASVLIVPLGIIGICSRRRRGVIAVLAGTILFVVVAWWLLTHRLDRFLIPHLPLVAILGGLGATRSRHPLWRRGIAMLLICGLIINFFQMTSQSVCDNRFFVSLDSLRRVALDSSLDEQNRNVHRAHVFLNENVRNGNRALCCGEAQVFNLRVPVLYNTCFDDCQFEKLLKGRSRDERLAALEEQRISHVFVFWRELDRYRSPGNYGYSEYVTRQLVRDELVQKQQILRPIVSELDPENSELFEVIGWRNWTAKE